MIATTNAVLSAEEIAQARREKKRKAKAIYSTSRICVRLFYCQALRQVTK